MATFIVDYKKDGPLLSQRIIAGDCGREAPLTLDFGCVELGSGRKKWINANTVGRSCEL